MRHLSHFQTFSAAKSHASVHAARSMRHGASVFFSEKSGAQAIFPQVFRDWRSGCSRYDGRLGSATVPATKVMKRYAAMQAR
jgi:hypothetical protein